MGDGSEAHILHADLDAFYASVEQLLDPGLRGRPIAVGGGVVLAASYEARALRRARGHARWRARQLCPRLRFRPRATSATTSAWATRSSEVFGDFTPLVERISIDEAFLDVAGADLVGPPADIAPAIRRRVRDEVGLPVSVGVARTKHLAKIASQVAKPDGLVVVPARRAGVPRAPPGRARVGRRPGTPSRAGPGRHSHRRPGSRPFIVMSWTAWSARAAAPNWPHWPATWTPGG